MGRVQTLQQDLNRWHGNRSQAQPAGPLFEGSGQLRGQKGSAGRETKQVWTQAAGTLFGKLKRGPAAGKPSKAAGLLFEGSGPLRSQKGAPPGTRCKSKRGVMDLSLEYPAADPAPAKRNQETRPCMAGFFGIDETRCRGSIQQLVHGTLWGSAKRQTKREIKVRPLKEKGEESQTRQHSFHVPLWSLSATKQWFHQNSEPFERQPWERQEWHKCEGWHSNKVKQTLHICKGFNTAARS